MVKFCVVNVPTENVKLHAIWNVFYWSGWEASWCLITVLEL